MPADAAAMVSVMTLRPMNQDEKHDALRTIIAESERLKNLAHNAGCDLLAFRLELVLHEARAILIADGNEAKATEPSDGGPSGSSVIRLPWPRKPRPRR